MKKTKITKVKIDTKKLKSVDKIRLVARLNRKSNIKARFEPYKEKNERIDNINPEHYKGEIETFDYLADKLTKEELVGFCKGNIIKYVTREKKKGGVEDLKKSSWYLNKLIIIKSF
jgi:hypothetical protein